MHACLHAASRLVAPWYICISTQFLHQITHPPPVCRTHLSQFTHLAAFHQSWPRHHTAEALLHFVTCVMKKGLPIRHMYCIVNKTTLCYGQDGAAFRVPIQMRLSESYKHLQRVRLQNTTPGRCRHVTCSSGRDEVLRSMSENGEVSMMVVTGTSLVQEACSRHKTSPTASAALGRHAGALHACMLLYIEVMERPVCLPARVPASVLCAGPCWARCCWVASRRRGRQHR